MTKSPKLSLPNQNLRQKARDVDHTGGFEDLRIDTLSLRKAASESDVIRPQLSSKKIHSALILAYTSNNPYKYFLKNNFKNERTHLS